MTAHTPPDPAHVGDAYDAQAATFDARFAADARSVARFRVVDAPQREIARGRARVLELGCGTGRLLGTVDAPLRVGVDVSRELLQYAARRGLLAIRADAHALPFRDSSFDAVLAGNGVFRYLDYARAFRECARVLAPGGRLAVHQYAARPLSVSGLLRPAAPHPLHVTDLGELRVPAHAAGFVEDQVYLWRSVGFYPHVVRLPERLAWRFWNHVTLVFRRP